MQGLYIDVPDPNQPYTISEQLNAATHVAAVDGSRILVDANGWSFPSLGWGSSWVSDRNHALVVIPRSEYTRRQTVPSLAHPTFPFQVIGLDAASPATIAMTPAVAAHSSPAVAGNPRGPLYTDEGRQSLLALPATGGSVALRNVRAGRARVTVFGAGVPTVLDLDSVRGTRDVITTSASGLSLRTQVAKVVDVGLTQRTSGGYLQAAVHAVSSRAGAVSVALTGGALTARSTGSGVVKFSVSTVGGRRGGSTQTFAVSVAAGQPVVVPTAQFALPVNSVVVRVGAGSSAQTRRVAVGHPSLARIARLGLASRHAATATVTSAAFALSSVASRASARITVSVYRGRTLVASASRVCASACTRAVGVSVAWHAPHGVYRTVVTVVVRRGSSAVGLVTGARAAVFRN